jgi:hypothetical protein
MGCWQYLSGGLTQPLGLIVSLRLFQITSNAFLFQYLFRLGLETLLQSSFDELAAAQPFLIRGAGSYLVHAFPPKRLRANHNTVLHWYKSR